MKNTFLTTTLAASMFLNAQQSNATNPYKSDIAAALTTEESTIQLTPSQQDVYERVDQDPALQKIFKTIRIQDGYVYFDSLGFAISLEKKLAKSVNEATLSIQYLTQIEELIWLENMIDLLNLTSRYIVTNQYGDKEFVRFSKVSGQYTGEIEKKDGEIIAVREEYEQPLVEKRIYPLQDDVKITQNNPFYVLDVDVL